MPGRYPLEIVAVHTDDERIYMSKGHHDPHAFMAALRDYGVTVEDFSMPSTHYVKKTPARDGVHSYWLNFVLSTVRGAFPATYTYEARNDAYQPPVSA